MTLFGFSALSALVALYFSLIAAGKAAAGGFADAPPLDEALGSVGVNVAAASLITVRQAATVLPEPSVQEYLSTSVPGWAMCAATSATIHSDSSAKSAQSD